MPATVLYQQGSNGALRDLDYINPRPPKQSSALPADVRARLLGKRSNSELPPEPEKNAVYSGAANAEPKSGKSGAGTDWVNPNGHAFVRKGSGVLNSHRSSRASKFSGAAYELTRAQSRVGEEGATLGRQLGSHDSGMPVPQPRKNKSSGRIGHADAGYARSKGGGAAMVSAELLQHLGGPNESAHSIDLNC
eukprot:TRINITY_DN43485_c0_g1_i1.p1 TRINITY_DN43485_c0_g1~~TRINITY_DN43485_c0_g1_i1.p1  ORF type:complete len:192 (-),score=15.53 TRINITY_DN43485_c0_g1_i1:72-647(-)